MLLSSLGTLSERMMEMYLGIDGGGRWGTASLELNDPSERLSRYRRQHDVFGSLYVGFNSDVLIPCGCCTWELGFRFEWDHTWIDVLPEEHKYLECMNFLFNFGVRY
jgi:hypothetical protein